jgi:hypothetical protein
MTTPLPFPNRAADEYLPPSDTGPQALASAAVTTSAANVDLNATWGSVSRRLERGGAYFSFQALGGTAYVRFKATATAASTSGTNGYAIADGETVHFFVPSNTPIVDVVGSASLALRYWQSSRNPAKGN